MTTGEPTRVSRLIEKQIDRLKGRKTQRDIADEAGFKSQNMISMLKNGEAKLALDRVPALAKALEVDPALLFRLTLEVWYADTTLVAIRDIFGTAVTKNETKILERIRELTGDSDPELTPALDEALDKLLKK